LTPIGQPYLVKNKAYVVCECDCGNITHVMVDGLRRGKTKSCGCYRTEVITAAGKANATHGMNKSPENRAWQAMKGRCCDKNHAHYKDYGGRGVVVCDEWLGAQGFQNFLNCVGMRPTELHSLDRIDNNGNYEPGNVRWSTAKQQQNNRRSNLWLTFAGERKTHKQWSEITGISVTTITWRIRNGCTPDQALSKRTLDNQAGLKLEK